MFVSICWIIFILPYDPALTELILHNFGLSYSLYILLLQNVFEC